VTKLDTKKAAKYLEELGVPYTRKTLEVWRCIGRGPRYRVVGRRVFYEKADLDEFTEGRRVETIDSIRKIDNSHGI
jgi:hypothetical protein